jgi:hypothetical protein
MLQIDHAIISFDILEKKFVCDLKKCKGACCVHGDSGAPLEKTEVKILEDLFPLIRPFMRKEGIEAIEKQGTSLVDNDGDEVTPLVNGKECAYVVFESGIAKCSIEKAYENQVIKFKKPLSCHLYPIRITKYSKFEALNYHQWEICKPAISLGKKENTPLYIYLKEPLSRKYGESWYKQLKIASEEVKLIIASPEKTFRKDKK